MKTKRIPLLRMKRRELKFLEHLGMRKEGLENLISILKERLADSETKSNLGKENDYINGSVGNGNGTDSKTYK